MEGLPGSRRAWICEAQDEPAPKATQAVSIPQCKWLQVTPGVTTNHVSFSTEGQPGSVCAVGTCGGGALRRGSLWKGCTGHNELMEPGPPSSCLGVAHSPSKVPVGGQVSRPPAQPAPAKLPAQGETGVPSIVWT